MDVYVVLAFGKIHAISARLQGAELIAANYKAQRLARYKSSGPVSGEDEAFLEANVKIENYDVRDMDD